MSSGQRDPLEHENWKEQEDEKPVRYVYGLTSALLVGGATLSLVTGFPAGAQVAQNDEAAIEQIAPRAGAPASSDAATGALSHKRAKRNRSAPVSLFQLTAMW